MSWASSEVVSVLTFLLPGFVAAAVFYSLTSHPKPGAFDRIVQALVFGVEPTLVLPAAKFVRCHESTPAESSASRCGSVV